jgi:hypothetical protein
MSHNYWTDLVAGVADELRVVHKQHHFTLNVNAAPTRQYTIKYTNGSVLKCGLWSQGRIPQDCGVVFEDNVESITDSRGVELSLQRE